MKFSEHWLREFADPPLTTAQLAEQLTMGGFEVDSVTSAAPGFDNVVVAAIRAVQPHPDAAAQTLCELDDGSGAPVTVVCGAPNVRPGLKSAYARPPARLPDGRTITVTRIRGVASHGMLCSEAELGLSENAAVILELPADAPPGRALEQQLGLADHIIDVDLTPNRGDCLCVTGIAREVAATNAIAWRPPARPTVAPDIDDILPIELLAPTGCPAYAGRIIRHVDPRAPTPLWMRERLRRCGLRSISPLVDVTNYVMLETGQPMHAFDLDKLRGGIRVRFAAPGETLTLLDGQSFELTPETLVIADHERAVAMAGIMGGLDTAVDASTTQVLLESAFFAPAVLAGRARHYKLHTDASHRFERGVSFELQVPACERATALVLAICGGQAGPVNLACEAAQLPGRPPVTLRAARLRRVLGYAVDAAQVVRFLEGLGMAVEPIDGGWRVTPPAFRFDIAIEADLIEEVARLAGYDAMPAVLPREQLAMRATPEDRASPMAVKSLLVARGYHEAITYSFVDPGLRARFDPDRAGVALANPLSTEMSVMRTSLLPGLIQAYDFNRNRQQTRVRLFEIAAVFHPEGDRVRQIERIAGLASGPVWPEQWAAPGRSVDYFDVKADVESLIAAQHQRSMRFDRGPVPALHPGQSARIEIAGRPAGIVGALHPQLCKDLSIDSEVYVFELDFDVVCARNLPSYTTVSKFPLVRRDIAVVLDAETPAAAVLEIVRARAGPLLRDLQLFDVYAGEGIDSGKKSLALGLIFQAYSSTLIDEEVDAVVNEVIQSLADQLGAALRS